MAKKRNAKSKLSTSYVQFNTSLDGRYPTSMNINDIKTQALLVFIKEMLKDLSSKKVQSSDIETPLTLNENDRNLKQNILTTFYNSLENVVPTFGELQTVIDNSMNSHKDLIDSKKLSPLAYFFNCIAQKYDKSVKVGESWIPEVLAISMIYHWIYELEKQLIPSYKFLYELKLDEIMNIYQKAFLKYKEQDTLNSIATMMNLSENICKILDNSKFPMNHLAIG